MESVWPQNEPERLEALRSYQILDTLPEASFDRLTRLAAAICGVPIALVSLIDSDRQWFKSRIGLDATETARNVSFCQYAILGTGILEVEDATRDYRFHDNPLVLSKPEIRFYAGAPLIDPNGYALGTLCVVDTRARRLTDEQRAALKDLADEVMEQIRIRQIITERKAFEQALAESRERYASIVSALPDLIFLLDSTGRFIDYHAGDQARLWLPPEKFLGKRVEEIMPADFARLVIDRINETLQKHSLVTFRFEHPRDQDGEVEYFEARMVPADRERVLCIISDISVRTRKAQKIAHLQQLLTLTGRVARLGAWEYWPLQDRLYLSEVARELLALKPDETVNLSQALVRFLSQDDIGLVSRAITECISDGKPFDLQLQMTVATGGRIWMRVKGAAVFSNGVCTSIHGTLQDIDAIRQSEIALETARRQAEAANQAKSEFLSNMSHELRTPLNSILGFSQLLEMNTERHLDSEELENVGHIRKAGNHLLNLISEILDLSRIESGTIELVFEDFRIDDILSEALTFVQPMAQRRNVSLQFFPNGEFMVHADKIRLKQVLLNVLTNAIKYNRVGGCVRIEYAATGAGYVRVAVSDTGAGIAEAQKPLLFQPFQRLGAETSTVEGTGIGLTISRRLMDLMHGEIFLRSTSTEGSEFCIDIPVSKDPKTKIPTVVARTRSGREDIRGTVLCVEDNPDSLRLMEFFFRRLPNITLLTARSAEQALRIFSQRQIDLVLLDIHLPVVSGFEVLRQMKAQPGKGTVPVVALSAAATRDDLELGRSAGFDDYLTKPVRLDRLEEIVRELLKRVN